MRSCLVSADDAENIGDKVQVFDTRHVIVQVGVIGNIGEHFLAGQRVAAEGNAADGDFARVELQNADDGFERRRLARAVMTDKAVDFAGSNVQAQIVDRFLFAVGFRQMFDFQHVSVPFIFRGALRPKDYFPLP